MTLLISFGAGVGAPGCASACGEPAATGRWIVALSLIIFVVPLAASLQARGVFRRIRLSLTVRSRRVMNRRRRFPATT